MSFEIENRNPILAGGFHAYVIAVILDKPAVEFLDIRVDGGKRLLDILRQSGVVGSNDGCNDNIFLDIKATADGVF